MSDHISFNASHSGLNTAKYLPFGPVRDVLPYLFRRAEENTSVEGQTGRELKLIEKSLLAEILSLSPKSRLNTLTVSQFSNIIL